MPVFAFKGLMILILAVVWILMVVIAEQNLITAAKNLDTMRYSNPILLNLAILMFMSLSAIVQDKLIVHGL